jgi:hypothetical protein
MRQKKAMIRVPRDGFAGASMVHLLLPWPRGAKRLACVVVRLSRRAGTGGQMLGDMFDFCYYFRRVIRIETTGRESFL